MNHSVLPSLRKKHKIRVDIIAKKLGVTRPTYYAMEKNPEGIWLNQVATLAELYNMTLFELANQILGKRCPTCNQLVK